MEEAQAKKRKQSEAEKKTAEGASGAARSEGNKEKDQQDATAAPLSVVTLDSCLKARAVWGVPFSLHTRLKSPPHPHTTRTPLL